MAESANRIFSWRRQLLIALLLAAVVFAVFSPLLQAHFIYWDDRQTVAGNPAFNPVSVQSVLAFWSPHNSQLDLYIPVTYTAWGVLAAISPRGVPDADGFTLWPAVFHAANIAMHALSAIVVWRILRRLVRHEIAALAGAVLFAVHPVQVEPLGWISGGKDVLSGMLALVAVWQYVRFIQNVNRRAIAYAVAMLAFMCATLAKPQAVAAPLVALVIDCVLVRRNIWASIKALWPWFAWCVPVILLGRHAQNPNLLDSPLAYRPLVALDALAFYIGKILWPAGLMVDYGRSPAWLREAPDRFLTWIVPAIALALCISKRKKYPWLLASLLILAAALTPVLGLMPFDFQTYSTVTDHYLYVAMLGPGLLLSAGLSLAAQYNFSPVKPGEKAPKQIKGGRNRYLTVPATFNWSGELNWWVAAGGGVAVVWAGMSFVQARVWRDTVTLFQHNYELNPHSLAAGGMLGVYWSEHGDMQRALELLDQHVQDHPDISFAHFQFANVLLKANLIPQAIAEFRRAIELDASKANYFTNFGVALDTAGRKELALVAFQEAARLGPDDPDNLKNVGVALAKAGQPGPARQWLERAMTLAPTRADIRAALETVRAIPATGPTTTPGPFLREHG